MDRIGLAESEGVSMRLCFSQRHFSWFDSYEVYDESGNAVFIVRGSTFF
jgi:uncharacterized protein YxjI